MEDKLRKSCPEALERLQRIIFERSFHYSSSASFSLVSGEKSHFYFDCKKTTLDPEGSHLVGAIIFEKIKHRNIKGIGGLTLGADPIASAVMHYSWNQGYRISHFVVRKELKKHGSIKWVEGVVQPGDPVIIVDDVVTTGGSTIKAIQGAQEDGLSVQGAIMLVDREEFGGMENIKRVLPDAPVEAVITRSDIMRLQRQRTEDR